MTGKTDMVPVLNLPSHLSQPSQSENVPIFDRGTRCYFAPENHDFGANPGEEKGNSQSHAPRARCPPCCRLWAAVWPRGAEVGYGYHPAYLDACWGAFRCTESEAGERGGVVDAPAPVTSAHSAGSCGIPPPALWSGVFGGQWGRKQKKSRSYGTTCGVTAKF